MGIVTATKVVYGVEISQDQANDIDLYWDDNGKTDKLSLVQDYVTGRVNIIGLVLASIEDDDSKILKVLNIDQKIMSDIQIDLEQYHQFGVTTEPKLYLAMVHY